MTETGESGAAPQLSSYRLACQASGEEYARQAQVSPEIRDSDLVRRALDGDFGAFDGLVARYERKAFWVAYHVLGRVEESRDVVQEAFVRVFRSLERFDFSKNFYTWLYRIVTNLSIDGLRKIRAERSVQIGDLALGSAAESELPAPERGIEGEELAQTVRRVLDRMPARFRTILALRDLHAVSCREIAPILGLTYATVRWRLHKARRVFREHWEREARAAGREAAGEARPLREPRDIREIGEKEVPG